ncbi:MAG: hypothetical protein JSS35_17030 [Proteobacteria bacterium]|nr:hypothetical protein [Pseudomonadota bacterium]
MRRLSIFAVAAALAGAACVQAAGAGQPPSPAPAQVPPTPVAPAQAQPAVDPAAVLQGVCSMCHGVDFITERRKDRDGWDFTVHRMIDKGADLDPDTAALLVDYLAKTYPKPADPAPAQPPPSR